MLATQLPSQSAIPAMPPELSNPVRTEGQQPLSSERAANLRTEYTELSRYFVEVVKFRFTVLGLFTAGQVAAFISGHSRLVFFVALVITAGFWIVEIRTRILYYQIGCRGRDIEKLWGYAEHPPEGYFISMFALAAEQRGNINFFGRIFDLGGNYRGLISHSFGIDIIYGAFLLADTVVAICGRYLLS